MNSVQANRKTDHSKKDAPARSLSIYLVSYFSENEIRYHFVQRQPSKIELGMWGISVQQWFEESEKALRIVQAKAQAPKLVVSNELAQIG